MRALRAWWLRVTEPRHLKAAMLVFYSIAAFTGAVTLVMPPQTIEAVIGGVTYVWSAFVLLGGAGGAVTVLPGWWWAERLCIVCLWVGIGMYAIVLAYLHFAESGSWLTQLGFLLLGAGLFYVRLLTIRTYSFDPRTDRG